MNELKSDFNHLSRDGVPRMVDISRKKVTDRIAIARARVYLGNELSKILKDSGSTKKGPVIQTAIVGAIQAAKRTSELIPMCHPIPLSGVDVGIELEGKYAEISVNVKTTGSTGVEMEALTAASVAALTIYDMCKSVSKSMSIESIVLIEKKGGKNGDYLKKEYEKTKSPKSRSN